jgi:PHD/YefM family antitoxin component YafN of YafNO toxin-antitoxin module
MPADVVVELRGALYAELGRACEDAPGGMPESKTRAGWTPVMQRVDAALGGLDMIGWAEPGEQQPLTVTLDAELIEVLEVDAEQWEWTSKQETLESAEGRARAAKRAASIQQFLASLAERPAQISLTIPVPALGVVREGAFDALTRVSEAIDSGVDPRECRQRLTAVCDLLDLIGWCPEDEPTADVDATEQTRVVAELTAEMVPILTTAVNDRHPGNPERAAAEQELCLMRKLQAEASGAAALDV